MTKRDKINYIAGLMHSVSYETAQLATDKFNARSAAADAALYAIMDVHGLKRVVGLGDLMEERAKRLAAPGYVDAKRAAYDARETAQNYRAALLRVFKAQANATTRARYAAQRAAAS